MDAKTDPDFVIMARTDALRLKGWMRRSSVRGPMLKRVPDVVPGGDYRTRYVPPVCRCVQVPILANITEFGATPLFTTMNYAVPMLQWRCTRFQRFAPEPRRRTCLQRPASGRHAEKLIDTMQTRNELYESINYYQYKRSSTTCLPVARRNKKRPLVYSTTDA